MLTEILTRVLCAIYHLLVIVVVVAIVGVVIVWARHSLKSEGSIVRDGRGRGGRSGLTTRPHRLHQATDSCPRAIKAPSKPTNINHIEIGRTRIERRIQAFEQKHDSIRHTKTQNDIVQLSWTSYERDKYLMIDK
jgi:hypothetical protein